MCAAEDIFDEIAKAKGARRYTYEGELIIELRNHARRYAAASLEWETTKAGTPLVYVDIVDSASLNAFASYRDGQDFIGINKGVAELVRSLFYKLLTLEDVFPEIGDPTGLEIGEPTGLWSSLPRDTTQVGVPLSPPQDEERKYLAERLTQFAYDFLIAHELAHVRHGHTRLSEISSTFEIDELEQSSSATVSEEEGITKQTAEMDADAFATAQGLANLFNCSEKNDRLGLLLRDKDKAIEYWFFAIYGLLRLFAPDPVDLSRLANATHPPARVRQMWIIQTALTLCHEGALAYDFGKLTDIAFTTASYLDTCIAKIAPNDPDENTLLTAQDPMVDEHLGRLLNKWCELRLELEPVCHVTNLTPCL
ncbi:MAG: hypothetical protein JWL77_3461 [Chthonomonadaceae bacterium]|nr:hypothetical protein [Chthonomonadaceae bacterium]